MFSTTQSSVNGLYQDTSFGNVSFAGDVFGPYSINYGSSGSCDYNGYASALEAAATWVSVPVLKSAVTASVRV